MDITPYTGMVRLQYRSLLKRYAEWYEGWASEMGVHPDALSDELETYLMISCRVVPNGKKEHKTFASFQDDEDTAKKKFMAYSEFTITQTNQWVRAMNQLDEPADTALAPEPDIPEDDEKNV
jgi:hypothetical protein